MLYLVSINLLRESFIFIMAQDNAIVINDLTKSFKNLKVLDGLNLQVERGTMLALLGPNGAGKTTTVRILSTLLQPDGGEVLVNGHDVVKHPDRVRASIGLTGQYAAVDEYLTATENLHMMGRLYHLSAADTKKRAQELLEQFDLVEASSRIVKTYSGGMRRRLDLALSLIATPPVIFLDEPTTGLDPRSRLAMWSIIEELVKADVTILLTTQLSRKRSVKETPACAAISAPQTNSVAEKYSPTVLVSIRDPPP